ncbi:MAG: helicase-exonuclease AddAB subunit AddA [Clostridia bacterium]|nr:helicase-exonuclease AddAB subunit AddA [Clostridia bacterium]
MSSKQKTVEWTAPQRDAINSRGGPILVSAAAGSGKTAVLSQRVIDIITDPNSSTGIDRFLIVTFTNLAADEMKERINKKLTDLLKSDPLNEKLLHQQLLLNKASISTIDGFCSALVREYFYVLDIPSDFRIADMQEVDILKKTAIDSVFERRYNSMDKDFLRLVDVMSGSHDDTSLKKTILQLFDFLCAQPFPKEWISTMLQNYYTALDPIDTVWGREIIKQLRCVNEYVLYLAGKALELVRTEPIFDALNVFIENEYVMIENVCSAMSKNKWDNIVNAVQQISFERFPTKRNTKKNPLTDEQLNLQSAVKELRDLYKKTFFDKIYKYVDYSTDDFAKEITLLRPIVDAIFGLEQEFEDEYRELKVQRGAVDYSDLEHLALTLLVDNKELAKEIAGRYDYVMVDEYQDVNKLQETIFEIVSNNDKTLFVVGDVKQSIYGFRQAMPELFIARKEISSIYDEELQNYPAKIILDANFRSRKCVTDSVNCVFGKLMSRALGGIDYTKEEALVQKASYPEMEEYPAEFHLIEAGSGSQNKTKAEAEYIGRLIRNIVGHDSVSDGGKLRPADYGDICIIMRSTNSQYEDVAPGIAFANELIRQGIPAMIDQGDSFFDQAEVKLVLSFLRTLENPARDISLAAVLMSPIFGFTANDIAALRAVSQSSLFELVLAAKESDKRAARFCALFDKLRLCSGSMTSYQLINRLYEETLLPEIVLSDSDGEYRNKNLLLLLDYAKMYEASGFKGTSGFVRFIDKLAEGGGDLSAAGRSKGSAENSVTIMTTHKSKGLEFPICIAARLGKDFNEMYTRSSVIFHGRMGIGTNVFEEGEQYSSYSYKGATRRAVELAMRCDTVSEELRLLYVAMTRAKERLILTAAVENCERALAAAAKKLFVKNGKASEYSVKNGDGFCEEILYCLMMSKDGEYLRSMTGLDDITVDESNDCRWKIVINKNKDKEDVSEEIIVEADTADTIEEAEPGEAGKPDKECSEDEIEKAYTEIKDRISRKYRYSKECLVPVKAAASVVAEKESGILYSADAHPAFLDSEGLTSAQRGTAMHEFIQRCDFDAAKISVKSEKERLVRAGYLSESEAKSISYKRVLAFLNSNLANEILNSDHVEKEFQFMAEVPAELTDNDPSLIGSGIKTILQGAIDCLYETPEGIVIVDYKTDWAAEAQELAKRYAPQLRLYKYAAEKIFEKPVIKCVLWSFSLGVEIEVNTER